MELEEKKSCKTQRLTDKSVFILDKVLLVNGLKTGRNKIIEASLVKDYPLFAQIFDKENE